MSKFLNVHIVIPTEDLQGEIGKVRYAIRVKFSMLAEDIIRFVENERTVKHRKEWIN